MLVVCVVYGNVIIRDVLQLLLQLLLQLRCTHLYLPVIKCHASEG